MNNLKFLELCLLSQNERSAFRISFSSPKTVLLANNGFGKSAIIKSLYDTLGAEPHKIDKSWRSARVTSLLRFQYGGAEYAAIKTGERYSIFDADLNVLLSTSHVMRELSPFYADMFDFRLTLTDKKDAIRTPPPSYLFAPYYVDQDESWQNPWSAFVRMKMFKNPAKVLSEYHSGLKPNAYYEAKAQRDLLKAELAPIETERRAVDQAMRRLEETMPATPISTDLRSFENETERLVQEAETLHHKQSKYRTELAALSEERSLWQDHVNVVQASLGELDALFKESLEADTDVECPMCGQHYDNQIADRFEIASDKGELFQALHDGKNKLAELNLKIKAHRQSINDLQTEIDGIKQLLSTHKEEITLRDVVLAEGRNQAQQVFLRRLADLDTEIGTMQSKIAQHVQKMKEAESKKRKDEIKLFFGQTLSRYAQMLDVRMPESGRDPLAGLQIGRGSEGPRARAAYYYAFLQTTREFGSSTFCPIVVDAPNQQGQDKGHLDQILRFLIDEAPENSQVIIGTEAASDDLDAEIKDISNEKNRVLAADQFDEVTAHIAPYLQQSIM